MATWITSILRIIFIVLKYSLGDIPCKCLCCSAIEEICAHFSFKLITDVSDDLNACFIHHYNIIHHYYRVSDLAVISDNTVVIRVAKDGTLQWTPGGVYETQCTTDVTYYPFDTQTCNITLATWGYTSIEINLRGSKVDTTYYEASGEWEFSTYSISSSTRAFGSNSLPQISFQLNFQRRPYFQVMNTIIPMILLASLSVFVFQLPPDSGEKMGYSLTTLLAFAVYLTLVSANIPTTSINTSCLCKYWSIRGENKKLIYDINSFGNLH